MGLIPSLGTITHVQFDIIVGSFFVFVFLVILFHCYLKAQHHKWLKNMERLDKDEWEEEEKPKARVRKKGVADLIGIT